MNNKDIKNKKSHKNKADYRDFLFEYPEFDKNSEHVFNRIRSMVEFEELLNLNVSPYSLHPMAVATPYGKWSSKFGSKPLIALYNKGRHFKLYDINSEGPSYNNSMNAYSDLSFAIYSKFMPGIKFLITTLKDKNICIYEDKEIDKSSPSSELIKVKYKAFNYALHVRNNRAAFFLLNKGSTWDKTNKNKNQTIETFLKTYLSSKNKDIYIETKLWDYLVLQEPVLSQSIYKKVQKEIKYNLDKLLTLNKISHQNKLNNVVYNKKLKNLNSQIDKLNCLKDVNFRKQFINAHKKEKQEKKVLSKNRKHRKEEKLENIKNKICSYNEEMDGTFARHNLYQLFQVISNRNYWEELKHSLDKNKHQKSWFNQVLMDQYRSLGQKNTFETLQFFYYLNEEEFNKHKIKKEFLYFFVGYTKDIFSKYNQNKKENIKNWLMGLNFKNIKDEDNNTPLHILMFLAEKRNYNRNLLLEFSQCLIDSGILANSKNNDNLSASDTLPIKRFIKVRHYLSVVSALEDKENIALVIKSSAINNKNHLTKKLKF